MRVSVDAVYVEKAEGNAGVIAAEGLRHVCFVGWEVRGCAPFEEEGVGCDVGFLENAVGEAAVFGPTDRGQVCGCDVVDCQ